MQDTYILIINWNAAIDTLECIDSIVGLPNAKILLIDNASADDSVNVMRQRFIDKAYDFTTCKPEELANKAKLPCPKITFILSDENLGFAKGNNLMLRYAILRNDAPYAWLFNNDAHATEGALANMIKKMELDAKTFLVGSVILDFNKEGLVQSCGVKYFKYFGVSKLLLKDAIWKDVDKTKLPLGEIDFQHGASMLVRLAPLKEIGLMDERYFLYFEEHDWQWTALEKGYKNVLATDSIIIHKGSVSTNNKKHLFFYYYNRSAIMFARKHSSWFVRMSATLLLTGITLIRAKFYYKSVFWGLKGMWEGYFYKDISKGVV